MKRAICAARAAGRLLLLGFPTSPHMVGANGKPLANKRLAISFVKPATHYASLVAERKRPARVVGPFPSPRTTGTCDKSDKSQLCRWNRNNRRDENPLPSVIKSLTGLPRSPENNGYKGGAISMSGRRVGGVALIVANGE
jgi:hypothetical protein